MRTRVRRSLTAIALLPALLVAACTQPRETTAPGDFQPSELTVFAAASLTAAFGEIANGFGAANGGAKLTFNFGGSQQLAQQLTHGAPADVFASANQKQMDSVVEAGRVELETARTFVRNRLVLVMPKDNPGHLAKLEDLATPGLKLVLAATEVPVGQYALEMLDKAETVGAGGFKDAVLKNVVSYEQDVRAVLAKVSLGEADAGVVYASDISQDAASKVSRIDLPEPVNVIASYPIAVVKDSRQAELAGKFVEYVRSPAGQSVLVRYGFISTTGDARGAAPPAAPVEVSGLVSTPLRLGPDDLGQLEQVEALDAANAVKGVRIAALVDKAGVKPGATRVTLVGGDGSRKELALDEVRRDPQAIVAAGENGSLRTVVPVKGPGCDVKGLVMMDVS